MKLLILSDLHANLPALEAIWQAESDCDRIYCAGDLVNYGSDPHAVIDWCREHGVQAVLGNHEKNILRYANDPDAGLEQISPEEFAWNQNTLAHLTPEDMDYLSVLPETMDFTADGYRYRMIHKYDNPCSYVSPRFPDGYDAFTADIPNTDNLPFRLILGHTHRQVVYTMVGNRVWLNPGSTSFRQADDPDKSAHYAIIEDGIISLRSVPYTRPSELAGILAEAEIYLQDKEASDINC